MNTLRHEDERLIKGKGKFTADWNLPEQCHAAMVRSDRAHAELLSVDTAAASALPGVLAVYTAADVTAFGLKPIPSGPDLSGIDDTRIQKNPMPILAIDKVRFVGQPVAMVVAVSDAIAHDAVGLVSVQYKELPAVLEPWDAVDELQHTSLHANASDNVSLVFESGDRQRVADVIASAPLVTRHRIFSQRLCGAPLEPRAVLADYNSVSGKTTVYTPTQGMRGMLNNLAAVTGLEHHELEIVTQDVGGSFGLRGSPYSEHPLLVMASRHLARPVKWVGRRSELFVSDWHGRGLILDGTIALDNEHNILALQFRNIVDLGAYNSYFGGFIGTNNLSVTMGGAYEIPALHMQSTLYYTNKVPVSAYRGAGRPDIALAVESMIERVATEHNLDPVVLRRKNFVQREAFPYTTANGSTYDCGDFEAVLEKALTLADYNGFSHRRQQALANGRYLGIGIGYYLEKSGAGGAPKDQVSCTFNSDGTVTLHAVSGPSGQGHETAYAKIFGQGLGIDTKLIRYAPGEGAAALVGNGTGGSRSLYGTGSAFYNLVSVVIDTAKPFAAKHLGIREEDLDFASGRFISHDVSNNGIDIMTLAAVLATFGKDDGAHPLNATAETVTGANYPNGCHIAECEINPDTGETYCTSYTAVDELGNVLNPELVRGQVHGGVVQGAGQVFGEQVVYDEYGQLLSGSFMDYAMPRTGVLQRIVTDTYEVPTELNELGAKGVGESGCSGSLPALCNAVLNALHSAGAKPMDMPFTPFRVWQHLHAQTD